MKKQIVINASKDRSRIAIVEDGELVELYVENPDNVRTIGNIYLGRVQKVMPAIRAAFVDVGQKQDCFLHFSDLTDNFPQLLAMAGEEVPGLEEPILSLAPSKRVADDETEPDVEEKLEVEPAEEESKSRRTRGRRSRGRGRGRRRPEEEEEEEERKKLPSVIDLSSGPRRRPTRAAAPSPTEAEPTKTDPAEAASAEAPTAGPPEEAPAKPASRRRTKKSAVPAEPEAASDEAPSAEAEPPEEPAAEPEAKPASRRSRRGSKKQDASSEDPASDDEAPETTASKRADAETDDAPETDGEGRPKRRRRRGGRGRSRRSQEDSDATSEDEAAAPTAATETPAKTPEAEAAPQADAAPNDNAPASQPARKALPSSIDLTSSARPTRSRWTETPREEPTEAASEASSADTEADDKPAGRPSRRSRTRPDAEASTNPDTEASEASPRSRRKSRSSDGEAKKGEPKSDTSDRDRGRRSRTPASGEGSASPSGSKGRQSIPPNDQLLRRDGRVIVKITKEPISTKGPRVSTDLSLAGRFLVLVPAADYVAVSKKIESAKERRRLRTLASSLKPDGFGVIVRTVAEDRDAKSLDTDLRLLVDKWRKMEQKLAQKPEPPVLLYEDVNMVSSVIRDLFSEDYDRILVDDPKVFRNVQAYVKAVAPTMADKVELHKGGTPVYRSVGIEKQVEEAFSKRVNMRGGGYLYIETTEAMHVVDVNSGRAGRGKSQKENLIAVNVEAAKEVAKQLRLRDLGGIIVVDFIDLKYDRDRKKVTDALKEAFKKDRAVTKLLPMSDFGLVQITRQRLRPSITTQGSDENGDPLDPAEAALAAGAGEIAQAPRRAEPEPEPTDDRRDDRREDASERPFLAPEDATPEALSGRLRGWLDHYRRSVDERYKGRPIVVRVHPLFGAYLRRGFPSPLTRWRLAIRGISFHLEEDPGTDPLAFDVRDQKSGRSLLKKYVA